MTMILMNTPLWVWPLLGLLVVLGLLQMRPSMVAKPRVVALPIIMLAVSIASVNSTFHGESIALVAWAVGVVLALAFNLMVLNSPVEAVFHEETQKFEVPGSIVPLVLMLLIFSTRFVVGVSKAIAPAFSTSAMFEITVSAILGFACGLFLSRAIVVLKAPLRRASSP